MNSRITFRTVLIIVGFYILCLSEYFVQIYFNLVGNICFAKYLSILLSLNVSFTENRPWIHLFINTSTLSLWWNCSIDVFSSMFCYISAISIFTEPYSVGPTLFIHVTGSTEALKSNFNINPCFVILYFRPPVAVIWGGLGHGPL